MPGVRRRCSGGCGTGFSVMEGVQWRMGKTGGTVRNGLSCGARRCLLMCGRGLSVVRKSLSCDAEEPFSRIGNATPGRRNGASGCATERCAMCARMAYLRRGMPLRGKKASNVEYALDVYSLSGDARCIFMHVFPVSCDVVVLCAQVCLIVAYGMRMTPRLWVWHLRA